MDKIKIISLNCQGINCPKKRRDVFNYIRAKNYSIICLQDTHITASMEKIVESEWGFKTIFSSYKSRKCTNNGNKELTSGTNIDFIYKRALCCRCLYTFKKKKHTVESV